MNKTFLKFGYPDSLLKNYKYWGILLRPQQTTLGSLVIVCKENVSSFSEVSNEAFIEFAKIIKDVERTLFTLFNYDKINYLMLMMVDTDVHFHVIPRYAEQKEFLAAKFYDTNWPHPPDLAVYNDIDAKLFKNLRDHLRSNFDKQ